MGETAEIEEEQEMGAWEGVLALSQTLDRMTEGTQSISRRRFVDGLESLEIEGERVVSGLLATGLLAQTTRTSPDGRVTACLELTAEGRIAVIGALCCL